MLLLALAPLLWWERTSSPSSDSPVGPPGPEVLRDVTADAEAPASLAMGASNAHTEDAADTAPCTVTSPLVLFPDIERGVGEPDTEYSDRVGRRLDAHMADFASSSDPEHLFALSLASERSPEARRRLVSEAVTLDPESALYRYHALRLCEETACGAAPELEADLLRVAPDNGEAWALAAASCLRREDADCAYRYLDRAGAAAEMRVYFAEALAQAERALTATDLNFSQRAIMSFALAAGAVAPYSQLTRFCRGADGAPVPSVPPAALTEVCIAYGERSARDGDTILARRIGAALAALGYEAQGYTAEAAQARVRARTGGPVPSPADSPDLAERLFTDQAFFHDYLAKWIEVGEVQAERWGLAESADWQSTCAPESDTAAARAPARDGEGGTR